MTTKLNAITHNVHEAATKVERVQGDIDSYVYDYFFKHVICWTHGSRQAIINFMFQRLFEECQELGIPRVWDEENGPKIVEILNRLNFKEHEQRPRPTRTRRTHTSPPVHKGKSVSQRYDNATVAGVSKTDAHYGTITTDHDISSSTGVQDPQEQTIN
jgi:hypothetical protein